MDHFAFTFAVDPGAEAAAAGVLGHVFGPGVTMARAGRVLHVTPAHTGGGSSRTGSGGASNGASNGNGRPGPTGRTRASIGEMLLPYRGTAVRAGAATLADFFADAAMTAVDGFPDRAAAPRPGARPHALLYRVRPRRGAEAARLLRQRRSGMVPSAGVVLHRDDLVVRFWHADPGGLDDAPQELLPGARDALRLAGLLDPAAALRTEGEIRAFVAASTMTLLAVGDTVAN